MGKIIDSAVNWMIDLATDDRHGYSQINRWGDDYDCSSAVITAWDQAGVPVKAAGATYTGNMRDAFLSCGFRDVKGSVNLYTGAGLEAGDVLLNIANHTAMYIGNGKVSHARSSEGNSIAGDQNGQEIRIQPYFNFPNGWDCVLRYAEKVEDSCTDDSCPIDLSATIEMPFLQYGDKSYAVKVAQAVLIANGFYCGIDGADGDFGSNTLLAVRRYQKAHSIDPNGNIGQSMWHKLLEG